MQDETHEAFILPEDVDIGQDTIVLEVGCGHAWSAPFLLPMNPVLNDLGLEQAEQVLSEDERAPVLEHLCSLLGYGTGQMCLHVQACMPCCD